MSTRRRLRCRLGLHRWVRLRQLDPDLAAPGKSPTWRTECRDCHVERGSGVRSMLVAVALFAVGGVVVLLTFSPLLGGLLLVGAVMAVGGGLRALLLANRGIRDSGFDGGG